MPDHIHLLLHICDSGDQLALGKYVYQLEKALAKEYWRVVGRGDEPTGRLKPNSEAARLCGHGNARLMTGPETVGGLACGKARPVEPIFERDWHDWIVMKDGQLAAFTRYIRENPRRAWLRHLNRQYFGRKGRMLFLSLWAEENRKPDNATLYKRCHEMGDIVEARDYQRHGNP